MELDKSYKVRVTPEQSREIQELVFGLGGKWNGGTDWVINEIIPFLYITSGLVMTCDSKAQEYFSYASSENTEILATELIAKLEQLTKNDKTMKLDDFLKCKKVRLLTDGYTNLNKGSEYNLVRLEVVISNNAGIEGRYPLDSFEPVPDQAENPLQDMKLTPEFESAETVLVYNCEVNTQDNSVNTQDNSVNTQDNSVNIQDTHKFRAGDKVYAPSVGAKVYTLKDFGYGCVYPIRIDCDYDEDHEFTKEGQITAEGLPILFLATELNHSLLSQLYGIEFERPPASLTSDELVRAMLKKGIKNVLCLWGNGDKIIIDRLDYKGSLMSADCRVVGGLTPIDWVTDEPLTEAILDE